MEKTVKWLLIVGFFLLLIMGVGQLYMAEGRTLATNDFKEQIKILMERLDNLEKEIQKEVELHSMVNKIIFCESSGRHNVWGDKGISYGSAQFQKKTFNWFKKLAGKPHLQWKNSKHQVYLLKWAIKNGMAEKHWRICYKKSI